MTVASQAPPLVFTTLEEAIERHGLARHVHFGHGPGLYVLVGRHDVEYLYCERCAKVTAVGREQLDPVRRQIDDRFGYHARFTHFAIVGLCAACVAHPDQSSVPPGGSTHSRGARSRITAGSRSATVAAPERSRAI